MRSGAWVALAVLGLIVAACALAPVYARHIAGVDPFRSNPTGMTVGGPVLAENPGLGVTPIGPGWRRAYLLGADQLGRDVAARLLYGGRNSLLIAGSATVLCLALALAAGVLAGFLGGAVDAVLSALLDLLWAFPVYLLAISLAIVLINEGLRLGPVTLEADSLALPILILGLVYRPFCSAPHPRDRDRAPANRTSSKPPPRPAAPACIFYAGTCCRRSGPP